MPLTRKEINEMERGVREVFRSTMGWGARMATYYVNDRLVVRATRRWKPDAREKRVEMVLTYGNPNFVERRFIRLCKQAGEPLPVKKVQVKWWPNKKPKKRARRSGITVTATINGKPLQISTKPL